MTDEADIPAAMVDLRLALAGFGVSMPPVPDAYAASLRPLDETAFATRDLPAPLYDSARFLEEYFSGKAPSYLAVGIDGYGMLSHFFHYYFITDTCSIFLQAPIIDSQGADALIARLNVKIQQLAKVLNAPIAEPVSLVDTIGAQYILHGQPGSDARRVESVGDPLRCYLASVHGHDDYVTLIRA